ncbi:MAG: dihydropteroate synthase [Micrococcaceae bacterium]
MLVMGILNVTPNSFSDGGKFATSKTAITHGLQLLEDGADIIDIGGESTRPGAERVSLLEEQERVLPVIKELSKQGVQVSIDTMNAETAAKAVHAGATIVNDVSGGLADEKMLHTVAALDVPYIAMHWRAHSKVMDNQNRYDDVAKDVVKELSSRIKAALRAGIKQEYLYLDPGIGFAKNAEQNWELLQNFEVIKNLHFPLLLGASRKRFLSEFGGDEAKDRDAATLALTLWAAEHDLWAVRVHEVKNTVQALHAWEKLHR